MNSPKTKLNPSSSSSAIYTPNHAAFYNSDDENYHFDNRTQDYLRLKRKYGSSLEDVRDKLSKTHQSFNKKFEEMSILNNKKKYHFSPTRHQTPTRLISRIEMMQKENDLIRRKYEKLNYHSNLIKSHQNMFADSHGKTQMRRPYEECYLVNEAVVREEYESKIDFDKVYKELRRPNVKQMSRVIDYAHKFDDFNEKTSVTTIGNSKFDDFELFEL